MTKRTGISILLACALLAGGTAPAGAAQLSSAAAENFEKNAEKRQVVTAGEDGSGPDAQTEQRVAFAGLEKRVRENNPTVKAMDRTLAGIASTDVEAQFFGQYLQYSAQLAMYESQAKLFEDSIRELNAVLGGDSDALIKAQISVAQTNLAIARQSAAQITAALSALEDAEDDAKDQLDDTVYTYRKQFENSENMLVMGAQSAYIGIVTMKEGIATLDRNLAMLDRNVAVVEKQVEIGMASQLTLDNLKQSRRTAAAQRETLVMQQQSVENQLALLVGMDAGTTVRTSTIPAVTEKQLREINYEKDLEEALKNSYSIWSRQDAVRSASNDYEDDVTATVDAYEAAKINLEAEKDNVKNSFRALYNDVQDKKRLLAEAEVALETQQKNFKVSELQFSRGMISRNDYLDAQDSLTEKEDAVTTAQHNLFTSYNTYDWARRGAMTGNTAA